jgi:hypothetical protein
MRPRRFLLVLLVSAGVLSALRRRRDTESVDVQFEDGSTVRLTRGIEARDLLDDVYSILDRAA